MVSWLKRSPPSQYVVHAAYDYTIVIQSVRGSKVHQTILYTHVHEYTYTHTGYSSNSSLVGWITLIDSIVLLFYLIWNLDAFRLTYRTLA